MKFGNKLPTHDWMQIPVYATLYSVSDWIGILRACIRDAMISSKAGSMTGSVEC